MRIFPGLSENIEIPQFRKPALVSPFSKPDIRPKTGSNQSSGTQRQQPAK
jgi:hypothetical protein